MDGQEGKRRIGDQEDAVRCAVAAMQEARVRAAFEAGWKQGAEWGHAFEATNAVFGFPLEEVAPLAAIEAADAWLKEGK